MLLLIACKAANITQIMETSTGTMIPPRKPDEERPLPMLFLLKNGWMTTSPNQTLFLLPLQPPRHVRDAKLQIRHDVKKSVDSDVAEVEWKPGSIILVFEGASWRTEPPLPVIAIAVPILPLQGE